MTHHFDRDYFNGGAKVGGYAREGYWDYPIHHAVARRVMEHKPESVLEIGAARGYVLRRLEDQGVRVAGLEISEHCRLTRAVEGITTHDMTVAPWPFKDKEFDLCLSVAVLEHIPEEKLPVVFSEMARVCKRGLHGIDVCDDDHFDKTHVTIRPIEWWRERLPKDHASLDKEELARGPADPPGGTGVKLNLGCFTTMFHYGWLNLDRIYLTPWAVQHGYRYSPWEARNGLPFDDDVVDLVFSCHMLEHLTYDEGAALLAECHRALKPGGVARFLVPDARKLINLYIGNCIEEINNTFPDGPEVFDEISPTAAARSTNAGKLYELLCAEHRSIYDAETLMRALREAGFSRVQRAAFRKSWSPVMQREATDLYPDLSLIMEAQK